MVIKTKMMESYASCIPVTREMIEDDAYNFLDKTFQTGESNTMNFNLTQTDKICLDSMQKNGETLGTMTLVMIEGSSATSINSVTYYALVQSVRTAIKEYLGGKDD